jgi:hypothetical protein
VTPIDAPCTRCLRHGDPIHARKGLTALVLSSSSAREEEEVASAAKVIVNSCVPAARLRTSSCNVQRAQPPRTC